MFFYTVNGLQGEEMSIKFTFKDVIFVMEDVDEAGDLCLSRNEKKRKRAQMKTKLLRMQQRQQLMLQKSPPPQQQQQQSSKQQSQIARVSPPSHSLPAEQTQSRDSLEASPATQVSHSLPTAEEDRATSPAAGAGVPEGGDTVVETKPVDTMKVTRSVKKNSAAALDQINSVGKALKHVSAPGGPQVGLVGGGGPGQTHLAAAAQASKLLQEIAVRSESMRWKFPTNFYSCVTMCTFPHGGNSYIVCVQNMA